MKLGKNHTGLPAPIEVEKRGKHVGIGYDQKTAGEVSRTTKFVKASITDHPFLGQSKPWKIDGKLQLGFKIFTNVVNFDIGLIKEDKMDVDTETVTVDLAAIIEKSIEDLVFEDEIDVSMADSDLFVSKLDAINN